MEKETPFPLIRDSIPNPIELFHHLIEYTPKISNQIYNYKYISWKTIKKYEPKYKNDYISFITQKTDYDKIDKLIDYFNEIPRMHAKRRDKKYSPIQVWNNREIILDTWIQEKKKKREMITDKIIREQIWKMGYECNAFKASLAKSIYSFFKAKRILDFSAGWGDRLLAAIAHNADRYLGYDPNIELQKGYQEIIEIFSLSTLASTSASLENKKYEIISEPFETSNIQETFDLICTSPPYFDFEIYISPKDKNAETQSITKYPKFSQWMIHFLFQSLWKSWKCLEVNGNMVIHLSDVYKTHYVESMILFILGWCKGSVFHGSISSIGDCGKPRPLWIFHKTASDQFHLESRNNMEIHYHELFHLLQHYKKKDYLDDMV